VFQTGKVNVAKFNKFELEVVWAVSIRDRGILFFGKKFQKAKTPRELIRSTNLRCRSRDVNVVEMLAPVVVMPARKSEWGCGKFRANQKEGGLRHGSRQPCELIDKRLEFLPGCA
jgi:hypothetical protein